MQQRALIEPRVPVLYVFPSLLLCHAQPYRNVSLDTDQRSAGRRQWSTKSMHGSGLSECRQLIYHVLLPSRPHETTLCRDNMYRTVVSLYPTTSVSTVSSSSRGGCYKVAESVLMVVRPRVPLSWPKLLSTVPELTILEAPVMLHLDSVRRFCLFGHFFPDRIDVRPVKIAGAVPTPTPN